MAKKKLTPEEKVIKDAADLKQRLADNLAASLNDMLKLVLKGFIPEPTIQFAIGEKVQHGAHMSTEILESHMDGKIYKILHKYEITKENKESYERERSVNEECFIFWIDITPLRTKEEDQLIVRFSQKEDYTIQFHQSTIHSFHTHAYHFGVDMNPDYQRGYVWTDHDKTALLDSIFNNIEIGKFVFIRRDYDGANRSTPHFFEILDGKQRLSTILDFWEGRFKYRGKTYFELCWRDQNHFDGFRISMAEVGDMSEEQILQYFIRLNTAGRPVNPEHLEKVKDRLDAIKETEND